MDNAHKIRILRASFDFLSEIEAAISERKTGEPLGRQAALGAHLWWYNPQAKEKLEGLRAGCSKSFPNEKLQMEMEKVFEKAISEAHSELLSFMDTVVVDAVQLNKGR